MFVWELNFVAFQWTKNPKTYGRSKFTTLLLTLMPVENSVPSPSAFKLWKPAPDHLIPSLHRSEWLEFADDRPGPGLSANVTNSCSLENSPSFTSITLPVKIIEFLLNWRLANGCPGVLSFHSVAPNHFCLFQFFRSSPSLFPLSPTLAFYCQRCAGKGVKAK